MPNEYKRQYNAILWSSSGYLPLSCRKCDSIQPDTADAGIVWFDHEDIKAKENAPFRIFSQSRYSIRDFGMDPVSQDKLENAFKLCERTPSACNRPYALHANDIANIPLTMEHKAKLLKAIKKAMSIPANEMPILLIGYGSYKDKWKVAASKRKSWKSYVSWNS